MKPIAIDVFDFGRLKEKREGAVPVAEFARLAQECVDTSGMVHWTLTGGTHESGHLQLVMRVNGTVMLMCQRCLKPFPFSIASESVLVLAHDEAQADQIEAMLDDDSLDVIVGTKALDVADLVEDEALLAIPQAPKHDECPGQAATQVDAAAVKPSPFAILKNMKH